MVGKPSKLWSDYERAPKNALLASGRQPGLMTAFITVVLAAVLITSFARGWRLGLGLVVIDLVGFILATAVASVFYLPLARILGLVIKLPGSFINLAAFAALWMIIEAVYRLALAGYKERRLF